MKNMSSDFWRFMKIQSDELKLIILFFDISAAYLVYGGDDRGNLAMYLIYFRRILIDMR
jgi:hypothetical protein